MSTYDEMLAHYKNLRDAASRLLHAVIDDGCDCEAELVLTHSGKADYTSMRERDAAVMAEHNTNFHWGSHNLEHTLFGLDVVLPVVLLMDSPNEIKLLADFRTYGDEREKAIKRYIWPHPDLREIAVSDAERRLADLIMDIEAALVPVVVEHVNPNERRDSWNAPEVIQLKSLYKQSVEFLETHR